MRDLFALPKAHKSTQTQKQCALIVINDTRTHAPTTIHIFTTDWVLSGLAVTNGRERLARKISAVK